MKEANIHKDHRQRMREKFDKIGFEGWSDYEILEFMLYNVYRQGDTNPIAHRILKYSANNIVNVMLNTEDFRMAEEIDNVGEKTVLFLRSLKAFIDYYKEAELKFKPVQVTRETIRQIVARARTYYDREQIILICIDAALNVRSYVDITEFNSNMMAVTSPERIIKAITLNNAKYAILVHNHPNGSMDASAEDYMLTDTADRILSNLGVLLIDHYILGNDIKSIKQRSANETLKNSTTLYDSEMLQQE